ncbi:hypothetical protein Leryth_003846, partial [Lithospermum erythrorhizon]
MGQVLVEYMRLLEMRKLKQLPAITMVIWSLVVGRIACIYLLGLGRTVATGNIGSSFWKDSQSVPLNGVTQSGQECKSNSECKMMKSEDDSDDDFREKRKARAGSIPADEDIISMS